MRLAIACLLMLCTSPSRAEYVVSFYSHEYSADFPHSFVTIKGAPDGGGPLVDADYGFTAKAVTPAIMMGSVPGEVENPKPNYVAHSQKQFSLTIHDAQYAALMTIVNRWRVKPGSDYNLNKHNCVSFVGEIAQTIGLKATLDRTLIKHPKAFLESVMRANPSLKP